MELVNGTYHGGHVELGHRVDWPEGTEVDVKRRTAVLGMSEEQWPRDPEKIEKLLKEWDTLEPLIFTQSEQIDLQRTRKQMGSESMEKLDKFVDKN
jgi:hypothetical protein